MNTIHIFYNGTEATFPENNDWEKFHGHDSVRVFLACAESWRRAGWQVKRLSTQPGCGIWNDKSVTYEPLKFTGRVRDSFSWYPEPFWQFIPKALSLEGDEFVFGTYDVFNLPVAGHWNFLPTHDAASGADFCYSYQRDHFSLSLIRCTRNWLKHARQILIAYDLGALPRLPGKYVSDETILRAYAKHETIPLQAFPLSDYRQLPLVHFARSTLSQAYAEIPVV